MTNSIPIPQVEARAISLSSERRQLFPDREGGSLLAEIMKEVTEREDPSRQGIQTGVREHPFDFVVVKNLMTCNEHHSSCILAKTNATVGLGHVTQEEREARKKMLEGDLSAQAILQQSINNSSEVDKILDPLCDHSWQATLSDSCQDFWHVGGGLLEIVRENNEPEGSISGIHYLPAEDAKLVIEDDKYNRHWELVGAEGAGTRKFACFGDLKDFRRRFRGLNSLGTLGSSDVAHEGATGQDQEITQRISEVIFFRQPTSLNRWYGYPDWLSAVAAIELVGCLRQFKYDFFNNRGVPEFMLFILGQKLGDKEWRVIEDALQANIGKGNSHKSLALNLQNADIKIQLEKLALENKGEDSFEKTNESLAVSIVTAHRVPPLLAGIMIPGKLGANNELPNALVAFQTLVIGQSQRLFERTLAKTLGGDMGIEGLKDEDFQFRKITEAFNLDAMDTMGRMRESMPEAQAEGRDLTEGVKKIELMALTVQKIAEERGEARLAELMGAYLASLAA